MSAGSRFLVSSAIVIGGIVMVIAPRGSDGFMLGGLTLVVSAIAVAVSG